MSNKIPVLDHIGHPSGIFGRRLDIDSPMTAIHEPAFQPRDTSEHFGTLIMAERLDTLEDKTVCLVNTGFTGGKEFMEELQDWLPEISNTTKDSKIPLNLVIGSWTR